MLSHRLSTIHDLEGHGALGVEVLPDAGMSLAWTPEAWRAWYAGLGDLLHAAVAPGMHAFVEIDAFQALDPSISSSLRKLSGRHCVISWVERCATGGDHFPEVLNAFKGLRDIGLPLSLCDIGEGFDGIARAMRVLPQYVKLSAGLIRRSRESGSGSLLHVRSAFEALGAQVIAEGLDADADLAMAQQAGIRYGLGYALGSSTAPAVAA